MFSRASVDYNIHVNLHLYTYLCKDKISAEVCFSQYVIKLRLNTT